VTRVRTDQRLVALTFDDGPDPRWTPRVLELLRQHHASATFFDVGRHALEHPDLVRAELDSGHEVGNHTWSHPDLRNLSTSAVRDEITRGAEAIRGAQAHAPRLFRPPYGSSDDAVRAVAEVEGYRTVMWDVCLERYVNHTSDIAGGVDLLMGRVRPGSIILAHDGGVPDRTRTMQALPLLLSRLAERGYRVVDITTLLAAARPAPASGRAVSSSSRWGAARPWRPSTR